MRYQYMYYESLISAIEAYVPTVCAVEIRANHTGVRSKVWCRRGVDIGTKLYHSALAWY